MATFVNRNGRITAQVVIKPLPRRAKTFSTMEEAKAWAAEMEDVLRSARNGGIDYHAIEATAAGHPASVEAVHAMPRLPASQCESGVYFLFKSGRCVYVGQSKQVHIRVREHQIRKRSVKDFDSFSWIPCPPDKLLELEKRYVDMLAPVLNIVWTPRHSQRALNRVRASKQILREILREKMAKDQGVESA